MAKPKTKQTFIIQILNCQHGTWQGTINWTNGQATEHFRSTLEMIKLIDSAVGQSEKHIPDNVTHRKEEIKLSPHDRLLPVT